MGASAATLASRAAIAPLPTWIFDLETQAAIDDPLVKLEAQIDRDKVPCFS